MPKNIISNQSTEIASIFLDIAELMADKNLPYYSKEVALLRDKLWDTHKIGLARFKSYSMFADSPEYIVDMSQDEQVLFVLFAVAFVSAGEIPT